MLGSEADSFIADILSAAARKSKQDHETQRCEQLNEMIADNKKAGRRLRKALRKLLRAEGGEVEETKEFEIKDLFKNGVKLVSEIIFGVAPPSAEKPRKVDEKARQHVLHKLKKHFNITTIEELQDLLTHLDAHAESLSDHAAVICAAGITKETHAHSIVSDSDDHRFYDPVKAFAQLLAHISPEAGFAPSDAFEHSVNVHYDGTLLPSSDARAPLEPPVVVLSGAALDAAGVKDEVRGRLMYHQVNVQGEGKDAEEKMDLRLVWKFEVRMQDNWYEASVDIEDLKIVGIADWGMFCIYLFDLFFAARC